MQRTHSRQILATLVALALSACASFGLNYLHPRGPRCADTLVDGRPAVSADGSDRFTIVSFNVKFGENPERASAALDESGFDGVDVLVLQEVDLRATRLIAQALGHNYVYYPAGIHPATERQFGLAILSPWPIRNDRKILLPWLESSDDARKIAVAATVWPQGQPVGVVNTHLQSGLTPVKTGDQLQAITGCVYSTVCQHVGAPMLDGLPYYVLAGDLNTRMRDTVRVADEVLSWSGLTRVPGIGRTFRYIPFGFDHIYASSDLRMISAGVISEVSNTGSDHFPIYAEFAFDGRPRDAWNEFDDAEGPWTSSTPPTMLSCDCPPGGCA